MHIDIEKAFRLSTPCLRYDNFFQKKGCLSSSSTSHTSLLLKGKVTIQLRKEPGNIVVARKNQITALTFLRLGSTHHLHCLRWFSQILIPSRPDQARLNRTMERGHTKATMDRRRKVMPSFHTKISKQVWFANNSRTA